MSIENQIADYCNEEEAACLVCNESMTLSSEGGYDILICDNADCDYKVWADGDEY